MFSRFKKPEAGAPKGAVLSTAAAPSSAAAKATAGPRPMQVAPTPRAPAEIVAADKEKKRKERLAELKVEMHKLSLIHI